MSELEKIIIEVSDAKSKYGSSAMTAILVLEIRKLNESIKELTEKASSMIFPINP